MISIRAIRNERERKKSDELILIYINNNLN